MISPLFSVGFWAEISVGIMACDSDSGAEQALAASNRKQVKQIFFNAAIFTGLSLKSLPAMHSVTAFVADALHHPAHPT